MLYANSFEVGCLILFNILSKKELLISNWTILLSNIIHNKKYSTFGQLQTAIQNYTITYGNHEALSLFTETAHKVETVDALLDITSEALESVKSENGNVKESSPMGSMVRRVGVIVNNMPFDQLTDFVCSFQDYVRRGGDQQLQQGQSTALTIQQIEQMMDLSDSSLIGSGGSEQQCFNGSLADAYENAFSQFPSVTKLIYHQSQIKMAARDVSALDTMQRFVDYSSTNSEDYLNFDSSQFYFQRSLLEYGTLCQKMGFHDEAKNIINDAVKIARHNQDKDSLARGLILLGSGSEDINVDPAGDEQGKYSKELRIKGILDSVQETLDNSKDPSQISTVFKRLEMVSKPALDLEDDLKMRARYMCIMAQAHWRFTSMTTFMTYWQKCFKFYITQMRNSDKWLLMKLSTEYKLDNEFYVEAVEDLVRFVSASGHTLDYPLRSAIPLTSYVKAYESIRKCKFEEFKVHYGQISLKYYTERDLVRLRAEFNIQRENYRLAFDILQNDLDQNEVNYKMTDLLDIYLQLLAVNFKSGSFEGSRVLIEKVVCFAQRYGYKRQYYEALMYMDEYQLHKLKGDRLIVADVNEIEEILRKVRERTRLVHTIGSSRMSERARNIYENYRLILSQ